MWRAYKGWTFISSCLIVSATELEENLEVMSSAGSNLQSHTFVLTVARKLTLIIVLLIKSPSNGQFSVFVKFAWKVCNVDITI